MNAETFYEQYWASGLHKTTEWSEKQFRRWLEPLCGKDRVLDYGCGLGHGYQRALGSAVKTYIGADVGPMALADLKRKGFQSLRIDPDLGTIDSPDAAFDGATCVEVCEHLFDPLQSVRELHRILKPGGVLVATVPNFGYHPWRLMALLRAQVPCEPEAPQRNRFNGVHIRYFSKLMFKRLLRDAGFTNIIIDSFDDSSIWDVTRGLGPLAAMSDFARKRFPGVLHMRFLQDIWPNVFAARLRAVAYKAVGPEIKRAAEDSSPSPTP